jgi:hypothetical protein
MKLRVFFKKEFKDGYFINPNCKITDIYNYYHFFGGYERESFIITINLHGTNIKYGFDIDNRELRLYKIKEITKIGKRFSYNKEFDETKINKSSKFKIYTIVKAWKNYNNYLKNIEDLKTINIKEEDILF